MAKAKPKEKPRRADDDFRALDEAIGTLLKWEREIVQALNRRGCSERSLSETLDAMRRVHAGEDE